MKKPIILLIFIFSLLYVPTDAFAMQKQAGSSADIAIQVVDSKEDRRVKVLEEFLTQYDSPLALSANTFVKTADTYNLDWKLVAAISGVESTFGRFLPYNSYNAWGWGIYGDNMVRFNSYDEAIETISRQLRMRYMDQWKAQNVYAIGKFYAASPTWASRVSHFMGKIDEYEKNSATLSLSVSL